MQMQRHEHVFLSLFLVQQSEESHSIHQNHRRKTRLLQHMGTANECLHLAQGSQRAETQSQ